MKRILTIISLGLYRPENKPAQSKFLTIKNKTAKLLKIFYENEARKECTTTVEKHGKTKIAVPVNHISVKLQWAQTAEENHPAKRELWVPAGGKTKRIIAFNKAENYGPLEVYFEMGIKWG